jgi:hypothetical protein
MKIKNLLVTIFLFTLFLLVLGNFNTGIAQEKVGMLDGKVFVGLTGEKDKKADTKEEYIFKDGKFHSSACDPWGFGDGVYSAAVSGDTINFEAETVSPQQGKMLWKGTVKGDLLEETHRWTKEGWLGKSERDYWGQGKLKM